MKLDDIREILDLVREHELTEFELERDGLKVRIRKGGTETSVSLPAPAMAAPPPAAAPSVSPAALPADAPGATEPPLGVDLAVITSPIVGTFYRSPEPGARSFVEVGDTVSKGQVLCIIEAMKLMNEIESESDGEVTAIYVENGKAVQFGDRLFAIKVK